MPNPALSITENKSIEATVFPNPTSDMVYIESDMNVDKINLYSSSGQKLASYNTHEINLSTYPVPANIEIDDVNEDYIKEVYLGVVYNDSIHYKQEYYDVKTEKNGES